MLNYDIIIGKEDSGTLKAAIAADIRLRWIAIAVLAPCLIVYSFIFGLSLLIPFGFLTVFAAGLNFLYISLMKKDDFGLQPLFVISGCIDIAIVTAVIAFTGGIKSPFFVVYFIILLDAVFDYRAGKLFPVFLGFILLVYGLVMAAGAGWKPGAGELYLYAIRMVVLTGVGLIGLGVASEMRRQHARLESIALEKEGLFDEIVRINKKLEEKISRATDSLEKTNLMLVKKNISLLAAHEIYKGGNEAKTKEEVLDMALGIIFPLMKGNGGIIFSVSEGPRKTLKVESLKAIAQGYEVEVGHEFEPGAAGEFADVLTGGKARLIEDANLSGDVFIKEFIKTGSCVAAPLMARGEVTGVVLIFNKKPYVYNKTDAELIELLGEQIGTLVHSRTLYHEARIRAVGLEKLMNLTIHIETSLEVKDIINRTLDESINNLFEGSKGVIMMLNDANELRFSAQYGYEIKIPDMRIAVNSIAGWVYKNNKSLFIRDARAIKYYTPEIDGLYIRGAAMIVPVSGKGKVSGIIAVTKEKGKYNRDDLYLLTILSNHLAASLETARLYADVKRDYINSIYALAAAVDAKDHYTHGHSATVMKYATKAAERMKLPQGEVEDIKYAALLHDIGKIGISETIINKPGKLTNEEYSIIKMHPQLGANIISKIESLKKLVPLVLSHHEWYNGAGYPLGLRGEEIPVGARIIALADAHSTITSKRPYREERSLEFALKELSRCAGTQFDPAVTGIFIEMLKEEAREQEDELKKQKRDKKAAAEEQINEQDKKRRLRVKFDRNMKRQGDVKGDKEFYS